MGHGAWGMGQECRAGDPREAPLYRPPGSGTASDATRSCSTWTMWQRVCVPHALERPSRLGVVSGGNPRGHRLARDLRCGVCPANCRSQPSGRHNAKAPERVLPLVSRALRGLRSPHEWLVESRRGLLPLALPERVRRCDGQAPADGPPARVRLDACARRLFAERVRSEETRRSGGRPRRGPIRLRRRDRPGRGFPPGRGRLRHPPGEVPLRLGGPAPILPWSRRGSRRWKPTVATPSASWPRSRHPLSCSLRRDSGSGDLPAQGPALPRQGHTRAADDHLRADDGPTDDLLPRGRVGRGRGTPRVYSGSCRRSVWLTQYTGTSEGPSPAQTGLSVRTGSPFTDRSQVGLDEV